MKEVTNYQQGGRRLESVKEKLTGSSLTIVIPFTTSVFGTFVTVQLAHGGFVGAVPGT